MGKTYRDKPAKARDIAIKKEARGDHRKMEPQLRRCKRVSNWEDQ